MLLLLLHCCCCFGRCCYRCCCWRPRNRNPRLPQTHAYVAVDDDDNDDDPYHDLDARVNVSFASSPTFFSYGEMMVVMMMMTLAL